MRIAYLYPRRKRVSFTLVAQKHIEQLRKRGVEIHEADCNVFSESDVYPVTIFHPILYPLASSPRKYRVLMRRADKLIGFEVCDTDHISPLSAYVCSQFDLVILPTRFCANVYKGSGVMTKIDVLPHGISNTFLREPRVPKDKDVKKIYDLRGKKILFFLWHSGFRKGADVVAEAFSRLVKLYKDVYLIVKIAGVWDPFLQYMFNIPNVKVFNKWLSEDDLVDLYDSVDIVVVPSRGGGFELNALEGLARGKIVIVSDWGAFYDYCYQCLRVRTRTKIDLFMGDKRAKLIHDGKGVDPDPNDLYAKLKFAVENMELLRVKYRGLMRTVRTHFTWDRIGDKLYSLIKPYL